MRVRSFNLWEVLLSCKDNVTAVSPARADLKTDPAKGRTANLARGVAFSPFPRAFALLSEIVVPFLNLLLHLCTKPARYFLNVYSMNARVTRVWTSRRRVTQPLFFTIHSRFSLRTSRSSEGVCWKNGEVMSNVQPSAFNNPVRTRKATIGISVGIGDARSQQPRCWGRGEKKLVTKWKKKRD